MARHKKGARPHEPPAEADPTGRGLTEKGPGGRIPDREDAQRFSGFFKRALLSTDGGIASRRPLPSMRNLSKCGFEHSADRPFGPLIHR